MSKADDIIDSCGTFDGDGVGKALDNLYDYAKSLESRPAALNEGQKEAIKTALSLISESISPDCDEAKELRAAFPEVFQ